MISRSAHPGWLAVAGAAAGVSGLAASGGSAAATLPAAASFWGGLGVGALAVLLVHRLTGGRWGQALHPPLAGAAGALPLTVLLAAALVACAAALYPWAGPHYAADGHGPPPEYFSTGFFVARAVACLCTWLAVAWLLGALGTGGTRLRGQAGAGIALVLVGVTSSLAAFDWFMSLDPHWYSAVFGLLVGVSWVTSAVAVAAMWLAVAGAGEDGGNLRRDTANLLLACILLWAYLALMQFITVWVADLPSETRWYLPRLRTGWAWLGGAMVVLHLAGPLPVLFSRRAKATRAGLGFAAGCVLAAQALNGFWLTLPTLRPGGPGVGPGDVGVFAGAGLLWLAVFAWSLRRPDREAATS